jgi:iron(III) transport system substrate-binding protein
MKAIRRRSAIGLIVAGLVLSSAACGGSSSQMQQGQPLVIDGETIADADLVDAAAQEGTLTIYTAVNETTTKAMNDAFTEDTGINVDYIRSPSGRLFERIKSEMGAGNFPADVVAIGDPSLIADLDQSNLFARYQVPSDAELDAQYKSKNGTYYMYSSSPTVLAYNTEAYQGTPPTTWAQLVEGGGQNRFGLVQASASAGGWRLALFMREKLGNGTDSYWRSLAATKPLLDASTGSLTEKLARGEIAIAAARPPEIAEAQKDGAPVELIWPSDGTPVHGVYMGVTAKASHPNTAQLYANWVMSKRGQSVQAEFGGDYSVREGVENPILNDKPAPALSEIHPDFVSDELSIERRDEWVPQWNAVFGVSG